MGVERCAFPIRGDNHPTPNSLGVSACQYGVYLL
jgi:hypothetical protein